MAWGVEARGGVSEADQVAFFESKIRPVLAESCYRCHSLAKKKKKGGFQLDTREGLQTGGDSGKVIVPGDVDQSLLIRALTHEDPDLEMPPDDPLSPEIIKNFVKWVNDGAFFPETNLEPAGAIKPWWELIEEQDLPDLSLPIDRVVDRYIDQGLDRLGISAAGRVSEPKLLRRLSLDLIGRPPVPQEINAFLYDAGPDRLARAVDRLIDSEGFVRHQAEEFHWLLTDGEGGGMRKYLEASIKGEMRWHKIYQDIILANYSTGEKTGAAEFIKNRLRDVDQLTNDVSVRFFGVNISCAQCHDHPSVDDWTQDRYYGMKSFFNRTFENGGFVAERDYGKVVYKTATGKSVDAQLQFLVGNAIKEPDSGEPSEEERKKERERLESFRKDQKPVPQPEFSRRAELVKASFEPGQIGYLSRAVVNRVWHRVMGRGLVMPLDQMHGGNAPSHPELLQWLSLRLVESEFDLKALIRGIVLTEAYQRDSQTHSEESPESSSYASFNSRPLSPKQYAAVLKFGSLSPEIWRGDEAAQGNLLGLAEKMTRDSESAAKWFQRPGDDFYFSVDEALLLSNDEKVMSFLFREGGEDLSRYISNSFNEKNLDSKINELYLLAMNRTPSAEELDWVGRYLKERNEEPQKAWKQVIWALLTSTENRFNH